MAEADDKTESAIITSAKHAPRTGVTADPSEHLHSFGEVDARLSEARAREILNARFRSAGIMLEADYPFREGDLMVTLDGYDPTRYIGFAYVSHSDVDVVTDLDPAAELALKQLESERKATVLVIHDSDFPTEDSLERRIDAFFTRLQSSLTDTQTM